MRPYGRANIRGVVMIEVVRRYEWRIEFEISMADDKPRERYAVLWESRQGRLVDVVKEFEDAFLGFWKDSKHGAVWAAHKSRTGDEWVTVSLPCEGRGTAPFCRSEEHTSELQS